MSERIQKGKVPPHNLDAEKSVLGAILIDEDSLVNVIGILKPDDFYEPSHRLIFGAMLSLYEENRSVDLLTTSDILKNRKQLTEVGGSSYLSSLTNYVTTSAHLIDYAEIVATSATRRRLIAASGAIAEYGFDEESNINELIAKAESEIFNVSENEAKGDLIKLSDIILDSFERINELHKNKGALRGIPTGWRDLDNMTAGLQKSDLIILAARPAMGKTTLVTNLAYNVAKISKKAVLIFSLEMGKEQLFDRMLADAAGVDAWNIRSGNLSSEDFIKISEAMNEMDSSPIYIDDASGLSPLELRTKARRIAHREDIGLIVIDYLQLMQGNRKNNNRVEEVSEISRALKMVAKELNVPVVALSQLSRAVESRDSKKPQLSDLRESGSIEQDADMVMFIHRPGYYEPDNPDLKNITELIIAKHRNGPVGHIELYFHPEKLRFMSLDKKH